MKAGSAFYVLFCYQYATVVADRRRCTVVLVPPYCAPDADYLFFPARALHSRDTCAKVLDFDWLKDELAIFCLLRACSRPLPFLVRGQFCPSSPDLFLSSRE